MRIHLFGNCQATVLRKLILEDHPDWTVSALELGTARDFEDETVRLHLERAGKADIVITQPVKAWKGIEALSTEALQASLRPDATLVTIPSIVFEGTHAAFTYLGHRFAGFAMPYHNSHTIDMFVRQYRRADIELLQSSPEFYTRDFVHEGVAASLAELRFKEASNRTTFSVADLIEDACYSSVVMNTINHPKRPLFARVLNTIYRTLSLRPVAREAGVDHLPDPTIPPLPTVLHHLGVADEQPFFDVVGKRYSRERYLAASLAYYSRLLRDDLVAALEISRGHAFLAAFYNATTRLEAAGSPPVADGEPTPLDVVSSAYSALLGREATQAELDIHIGELKISGLRAWLAAFCRTPEFAVRHVAAGREPGSNPKVGDPTSALP